MTARRYYLMDRTWWPSNRFTKRQQAKFERQGAKKDVQERVRDYEQPCECHSCDNPTRHEVGNGCYYEEHYSY